MDGTRIGNEGGPSTSTTDSNYPRQTLDQFLQHNSVDVCGSSVHGQTSAPVSDQSFQQQIFTESSKLSPTCPTNYVQGCPQYAWPEQQHMDKDTEFFEMISSCGIDGIVEFMKKFGQMMTSYQSANNDLQNIHQALHSTNEKDVSRNLKLENEALKKMVDEYKANCASQANAIEIMKTILTQMQIELKNHDKVNTESKQLKENLSATTVHSQEQLNAATNKYKDLQDMNAFLGIELLEHKKHCTMNTGTIETQKQEIKEMIGKLIEIKKVYQWKINAQEKELSDTKSRLSKVLGHCLTEGNPDVTDLSDKNRPTKLAERYQELYDNQWTDAFIVAEKYFYGDSEQFRIETLVKILLRVKQFCEEQLMIQDNELIYALCRTSHPQNQLPSQIWQQFKMFKKNVGEEAVVPIYEKFLESIKSDETAISKFTLTVPHYVKECVALCWLMTIQDPLVVFDEEQQDFYNSNKYRAYTRSGDKIQYIVWPALYLHKNGQIIVKGVAQCYKSSLDQTMDENTTATCNNFTTPRKETSITNETKSNTGQFQNQDGRIYFKANEKLPTQVNTDPHISNAKEGQGQHFSLNKSDGNTSTSVHSQVEQRQGIVGASCYTDNKQYQGQAACYLGYDLLQPGQNNLWGSSNGIYPHTNTFSQHGQRINASASLQTQNSHVANPNNQATVHSSQQLMQNRHSQFQIPTSDDLHLYYHYVEQCYNEVDIIKYMGKQRYDMCKRYAEMMSVGHVIWTI